MRELVLAGGGVLGEGAAANAEHVVADFELVTSEPTATTVPATSSPGTWFFGPRNPKPMTRIRYGWPVIMCQVPRSNPAAWT